MALSFEGAAWDLVGSQAIRRRKRQEAPCGSNPEPYNPKPLTLNRPVQSQGEEGDYLVLVPQPPPASLDEL